MATIAGAIDNDPEIEVKKKAVFALSQLPADEGVPKLIDIARSHRNPEVRKQAMFWLESVEGPARDEVLRGRAAEEVGARGSGLGAGGWLKADGRKLKG